MPECSFTKFSPSGNTTVFLHGGSFQQPERSLLCSQAISHSGIGGEQAACADLATYTMFMGGDEFCANACRAFGALLDLENCPANGGAPHRYMIIASGNEKPVILDVEGQAPSWHVKASFATGPVVHHVNVQGCTIVRLPGICHILSETGNFPEAGEALALAPRLVRQLGADCEPASGVIWWHDNGEDIKIFPFVQVPASRTAVLESACGSGSLALALHLARATGKRNFSILQPSGSVLEIQLSADHSLATVGGPVALVARGTIWLQGNTSGNSACN